MKRTLLFAIGLISLSGSVHSFEIYAFVPYPTPGGTPGRAALPASQAFFEKIGVKTIKVVYENELFDKVVKSDNPNFANPVKVRSVAKSSDPSGKVPVSLDVESWNRFDQATPDKYLKLLSDFNATNPDAKVGIYSTIPQNIYKWNKNNIRKYEELNSRYSSLAAHVDYISPSFYNYSGRNISDWTPSVKYNMEVSRRLAKGKPIIPFITPELAKGRKDYQWLSYDEMLQRLKYLKQAGAAGVIIWTSSNAKDAKGNYPTLNINEGWIKAIVDFQSENID